jgi:hypothetical protein
LLASQLYQISAHNPVLLGGTTILLGLVAIAALSHPGATRHPGDPIIALRYE